MLVFFFENASACSGAGASTLRSINLLSKLFLRPHDCRQGLSPFAVCRSGMPAYQPCYFACIVVLLHLSYRAVYVELWLSFVLFDEGVLGSVAWTPWHTDDRGIKYMLVAWQRHENSRSPS